jgi:hypothetical protein
MALPTTMPMQPNRKTQSIPENEEQPIHPLYKYAYIADREEGLILTDVTTLTDGNPSNNFLTRALTWNPDGALTGASAIYVAGRWLYMGTDAGLQVIDINSRRSLPRFRRFRRPPVSACSSVTRSSAMPRDWKSST